MKLRRCGALYIQGYLWSEMQACEQHRLKKGAFVEGCSNTFKPSLVARSLGFHVESIAPCYPDPRHPRSMEIAASKRFLRELPKRDPVLMRDIRQFVRVFCRKHVRPLARVVTPFDAEYRSVLIQCLSERPDRKSVV